MTDQIIERGIVLSTSDFREYDRRLVVLTEHFGKITVFANGARRQNNRNKAAAQSFNLVRFTLRQGRDSYTLLEAEIERSFIDLTMEPVRYATASLVSELTEYYAQENLPGKDQLNLLYVTYLALLGEELSPDSIRAAFILKLLHIEGEAPRMDACIYSGSTTDLCFFDAEGGGLVAKEAAGLARNPITISETAVYAIRYIYSRPIGSTYSFKVSDQVASEILRVAEKMMHRTIGRTLRSEEILKGIQSFSF